jgi:hypothetical protein
VKRKHGRIQRNLERMSRKRRWVSLATLWHTAYHTDGRAVSTALTTRGIPTLQAGFRRSYGELCGQRGLSCPNGIVSGRHVLPSLPSIVLSSYHLYQYASHLRVMRRPSIDSMLSMTLSVVCLNHAQLDSLLFVITVSV